MIREEDMQSDNVQKIIRVLPLWQYIMGLITAMCMVMASAGMLYQKLQSMQESMMHLTITTRSNELHAVEQRQINTEYRAWLERHDKEIDRIRDRGQ